MTERERVAAVCRRLGVPGGVLSLERNPHCGMNNATWIVRTAQGSYLCRIPGAGTELFCNRAQEKHAYEQLAGRALTDELVGYDARTGAKATVFYPGSRTCDPRSASDRRAAMALARRLHASGARLMGVDDPLARLRRYARAADRAGALLTRRAGFAAAMARISALRGEFACGARCPVHADFLPANVLIRGDGSAMLIDLEFASMGSPYGDLADFCHDAGFSREACRVLLEEYLERAPSRGEAGRLFAYCACVALMWSAWAAFKACAEPDLQAFFADYRDRSIAYSRAALCWYDEVLAPNA